MTETRSYKKAFKWTLICSIIVIAFLVLNLVTYNSRLENYRETHEYKCRDGYERYCYDEDEVVNTCRDDQFGVCIGNDETYTVCDTDRREIARCVNEGSRTITCDDDQWPSCRDKDKSYVTCDPGYSARCLKEGVYAVFNGQYTRECNIGQTPGCYT